MRRSTTPEFIQAAWVKHSGYYSYEKSVYVDNSTEIIVTCPIHGDFPTTPSNHKQGSGCYECGIIFNANNLRKTLKQFKVDATTTHRGIYKYSKVIYTGAKTKVIVTCPKHGDFPTTPDNHIRGKGCPTCANLNRNKWYLDEPTILYYIRLDLPKPLYKIGVTAKRVGIAKRYQSDKIPYTIIAQQTFHTGKVAYMIEQYLLQEHKANKYKGPNVLKGGNSELFNSDVLQLDKGELT